MYFQKLIFKHLEFRLFATSARANWIVMLIPTMSYALYDRDCKWRHGLMVSWLNWTAGFVFHKHSNIIES